MTMSVERSITVMWLLLLAATALSFAVSRHVLLAAIPHAASAVVLVIAFFKVRLIGLHFMELHRAILPLRLGFEAWIAALCITLLVLLC